MIVLQEHKRERPRNDFVGSDRPVTIPAKLENKLDKKKNDSCEHCGHL